MTNPTLVSTPFANTGTKNSIPNSGASEPQLATMEGGFPLITQTPIAEGGIPPERADFNGILNLYGQHIVHLNKGLSYEFDAAFALEIGGYPLNARLQLNDGVEVISTIANNTNDPNSNMTGWKRYAIGLVVSPENFGADASNSDNTSQIQAAMDFIKANGGILDGGFKTYKAANLVIDSNMSIRNIYLENNVFDTNLISVITTATVDAERTPLKNVELFNVHIDGKRSLLTGMPTGASSEDGGRHGFRFIRPMQNVVIRNCSANYCGVDGIMIFPIRDIPPAEWQHWVKNVVIENCDFHFNGRHGGSSDSADGLLIRNTRLTNNGTDLVASPPLSSGNAGRRDAVSGLLYGNGWDFEEYFSASYSTNMLVEQCVMIDNASSGLAFVRTGGITDTSDNILIVGGKYDKGSAGVSTHAIKLSGYLIDFYDWYDVTLIDVDFSGDEFYLLRSKAALINPKNLSLAAAVDQSTLVSDTAIPIAQSASTVTFSSKLELKTDNISQQQVINIATAAGSTANVLFYDPATSTIKGGVEVESGGAGDATMYLNVQNGRRWLIQSNGGLLPNADATQNIGWVTNRVNNIYLANAPNVSSDARLKTDVKNISEVERLIANDLKSLIKTYRLKSDDSKIHVGVIAQEVVTKFSEYGLAAHDYNMIDYDGDMYSVRYEELIMFILSST